MANKEQLAILKQGVAAWNEWREENPDVKIDLRGEKLEGMDLSGINFWKSDIREANFYNSILKMADFTGAIIGNSSNNRPPTVFIYTNLTGAIFDNAKIGRAHFIYSILDGTSWRRSKFYQGAYGDTILADSDVRDLLTDSGGRNLSLKGKNLKNTLLVNFDLRGVDLRETNLLQANLSGADITGAKLYGTARENWIIDGIRCEYVYWDEAGEVRTPPDRDFRPGEFEELYKQLPTFEYIFEQGFTPLDPLIMNRVVQAVNEQHKEFSLELVNFDKRGEPHATFTVCRLDFVDAAKEQITAGYEKSKGSPEQQAQLMAAVLGLIENQNKLIDKIPSSRGLAMGDTYNIHGGQIGAVGQSASASGNTFQQITAELSRVHEEMQRSAKTPEQHAAAEDVAKAAQAASEQNEPAMQRHLKNAGKFAVDFAKNIVTDVTAEYLKKTLEM
jgi:uncharacterized protein YjbI with pentapeptide repeats